MLNLNRKRNLSSILLLTLLGTFCFSPISIASTSINQTSIQGDVASAILMRQAENVSSKSNIGTIEPGDKLNILVHDEPDLSRDWQSNSVGYQVNERGFLDFPLIGMINTKGLTTEELKYKITDQLANQYIINPSVTVYFHSSESSFLSQVAIIGSVMRPGTQEFYEGMTMLSLLQSAGGFQRPSHHKDYLKPATDRVQLIRSSIESPTKKIVQLINIDRITQGLADDVILQNNDLVIVPFESRSKSISIVGQVNKPGIYEYADGLTIVKALSMAQGIKEGKSIRGIPETGDLKNIKVVRKNNLGKKQTVMANVHEIYQGLSDDMPILPSDMIIIPKKQVNEVAHILGQVNKQGSYPILQESTIIELITAAQGFTRLANPNKVKITRKMNDQSSQVLFVNINRILEGLDQNMMLMPGDIVHVPESLF